MSVVARWIRLGSVDGRELRAAGDGLARAQDGAAAPMVLWARASALLCLGGREARSGGRVRRADADEDLIWVEPAHYLYVLIVPRRLAPGRRARWGAWGLAAAAATYRYFGFPACLDDDAIRLQGRRIAGARVATIGECVLIAAALTPQGTAEDAPREAAAERREDRDWTALNVFAAPTVWPRRGVWPREDDLERVLRGRIEAQHEWHFEHSWPGEAELEAIDAARSEHDAAFAADTEPVRAAAGPW